MSPMDPAAINDHHNLFVGFPKDVHNLMEVLAECLGIKMGDDLIEDARGPILHGTNDVEQHATGDPAPGARAKPRLAFECFVTFDVTLAYWTCGETRTLRCPPPARAGQGKAPEDGFVFIQQNDFALASPILQSGEFERGICEVCGVGIKATSGTIVAYLLFFNPRSRG